MRVCHYFLTPTRRLLVLTIDSKAADDDYNDDNGGDDGGDGGDNDDHDADDVDDGSEEAKTDSVLCVAMLLPVLASIDVD